MLWEDVVELPDGVRLHVRPVRPSDRALLEEGWLRLSPASRRLRFLTPRERLGPEELDYPTNVDGVDHHALGAVTRDADGREAPVALARFVRLVGRPREADVAVTVVDEFQHRGVGTVMLERLVVGALKRGIETFRADLLPENEAAQRLIRKVAPRAAFRKEGALLRCTIPLEPA